MFLKELLIECNSEEVRKITFQKGINLIIDNTDTNLKTTSGNSVGKTTVLRLIDFCLAGKGENIYIDPEFKNTNKKIANFLKNNNVLITLTLVEDLDDESSEHIIIERNFLARKDKIQRINGEQCKNDDFPNKLKNLIFKTNSSQPTFKQLKSKNIRDEKNKLTNTIKVLPAFTTEVIYETLHLFWFGVDIDLSKDKLIRDKNLELKLQQRLRQESNLSKVNQHLIFINKKIKELEEKQNIFNSSKMKYQDSISRLTDLKKDINIRNNSLSSLEIRKELILESKSELENNIADIDKDQIHMMYKKAKSLIPDLQKTFEETLEFHNEMIKQKLEFITEELPDLEDKIYSLKGELNKLLDQEEKLSFEMKKSGVLEDLQKVNTELYKYHEQKGHLEELKDIWDKSNTKLEEIEENLNKINDAMYSKDTLIQKRIEQFNSIYSNISNRLDGVHSLLSAENENGIYKFSIDSLEGNIGTGSKKSQMASFDLAYIQFADQYNIPCLHFVLQDQIENVHSNQITNLFQDIVNEVNCQYILPVLRDKLPLSIDIKSLEVLTLSQENKLFKVK